MSSDEQADWTREDQAMLDRLSREKMPDPSIEERIVASLRASRVLGQTRAPRGRRQLAVAAAIVAAFIAGLYIGRATGASADSTPVVATRGDSAQAVVTYYMGI